MRRFFATTLAKRNITTKPFLETPFETSCGFPEKTALQKLNEQIDEIPTLIQLRQKYYHSNALWGPRYFDQLNDHMNDITNGRWRNAPDKIELGSALINYYEAMEKGTLEDQTKCFEDLKKLLLSLRRYSINEQKKDNTPPQNPGYHSNSN